VSKKLTLNEKKLLNDAVTGETKRCLAVLNRVKDKWQDLDNMIEMDNVFMLAMKEMIEGSPYIEFHPKLLKRIPKIAQEDPKIT